MNFFSLNMSYIYNSEIKRAFDKYPIVRFFDIFAMPLVTFLKTNVLF